jgi:hypothetical protein
MGDDCNTAYCYEEDRCVRGGLFLLAQKEVIHEGICCALSFVRHDLSVLGV